MAIIACGAGCASTETPRASAGASTAGARPASSGIDLSTPHNTPAGDTKTNRVIAGVRPLGSVPNDNMTLPLVSPDLRRVVTQTGASPTPETLLARPEASVPVATRLEVYTLDMRNDIDGKKGETRHAPVRAFRIEEPAILGRSCDAKGFLIESPREDGSRWIGRASWDTGEITWLVQDDSVNAFASLGPGGQLAWARRAKTTDHFELVVRNDSGEWSVPAGGEDRVMPSWSVNGEHLFVFRVEAASLAIECGLSSDEQAFTQSARSQSLPLLDRGRLLDAYQAMNGSPAIWGARPAPAEQIVFWHPGFDRCFLWRPLAIPARERAPMPAGSFAALVDDDVYAFVSLQKELIRQNLANPRDRASIVAGIQVPRPTGLADWAYVLLSPAEGRIGITAMQLLPADAANVESLQAYGADRPASRSR